MDLGETKQTIHQSKSFDKSYPKMYFLMNLSNCVKRYGHLCQILACFALTTHQILSSYVTQAANFQNFQLSLILHMILGKVTKFGENLLKNKKLCSSQIQIYKQIRLYRSLF